MSASTNITMKDIARDLGVSVATVSRALKDSPRISAEKREEIKKYAQEHNFYPNILAESLRKSKVQPMKLSVLSSLNSPISISHLSSLA